MESRANSLIPQQFGPLQGLRIISSGTYIAEPFAAALAAQMGAEVIHIERPGEGDIWRIVGPQVTADNGATVHSAWVQERRNTFNITLDMSTIEGKDLFLGLVSQADMWMESSKPGTYNKWGLDDDTVLRANPRIVITHVSGYGQDGPYKNLVGHDINYIGIGGALGLIGAKDSTPTIPYNLVADYAAGGMQASIGILSALMARQHTGRGQYVDIAMSDGVAYMMASIASEFFSAGTVPRRGMMALNGGVPYYNV